MEVDLLKLYKGKSIVISDRINLRIPTINDIADMGEKEYFSAIQLICSTGADLTWQLADMNIDYTQIDDYELFTRVLHNSLPNSGTVALFGNILDFSKMIPEVDPEIDEVILKQHVIIEKEILLEITNKEKEKLIKSKKPFPTKRVKEEYDIIVDRYCYNMIVDYVRAIHGLKRNSQYPGNEATKKYIIRRDRNNYMANKDKKYESQILPLISSMVNSEGFKENRKSVFDINIFSFMDSVKRISKIKQANLLLQSGYSGFGINLKETNEEDINWKSNLYK